MSASTTRPVQYSAPLLLSILARPHHDGLMRSWRADSLCLRVARSPELPHVAKVFRAFRREILIQGQVGTRNNDSKEPMLRFDSYKFLFHRARLATFATQSPSFESGPDMLSVSSWHFDPTRTYGSLFCCGARPPNPRQDLLYLVRET